MQLPIHVRALFHQLRFRVPSSDVLLQLDDEAWRTLLSFSDRTNLTLALSQNLPTAVPAWVTQRLRHNLEANTIRWQRLQTTTLEIQSAFREAHVDYLVLKGFSHCPGFAPRPELRTQNDLDLYFPPPQLERARDALLNLGYEPISAGAKHPIDHLPAMIRKTGWQWRGDYFDVDIPISCDLHFRLWDAHTEGFGPIGLDSFWERRITRGLGTLTFSSLAPQDALAYACLHALRHTLRGDMRPSHFYEIASFLERHQADDPFWLRWSALHDSSLQRLQAVCFSIAREWFDCALSAAALAALSDLPAAIQHWVSTYSYSPIREIPHVAKTELWLHWSLLSSNRAKLSIALRRLLPVSLPGPVAAVHLLDHQRTLSVRLRARFLYILHLVHRSVHHLRALIPTLTGGISWFGRGRLQLGRPFWQFLAAATCFNLGLFIYFLLYNLYLLKLDFREDFIGYVTAAMTTGSLLGSLAAISWLPRFRARTTLVFTLIAISLLSALRALVTTPPLHLLLALLSGMISSCWAVSILPVITQLTTPSNRTRGFSIFFSTGIAVGFLGGLIGGALPAKLATIHALSKVATYRTALLIGSTVVLAGIIPLRKLKLTAIAHQSLPFFRLDSFLKQFIIAIALWNLGVGALNPFFNVLFTRMHMPLPQLGIIFSASQLIQALAVSLSPLVLRKLGLIRGISTMQLVASTIMLSFLVLHTPSWAGIAYIGFMATQYMGEPGTFTLLMERVEPGQRTAASGLNFLVTSAAQAVAASLAGLAVTHFGYSWLVLVAALIAVAAASLFRKLSSLSPQASVPDNAPAHSNASTSHTPAAPPVLSVESHS